MVSKLRKDYSRRMKQKIFFQDQSPNPAVVPVPIVGASSSQNETYASNAALYRGEL